MHVWRGAIFLLLALGFWNVRTYGQTSTWIDGNGNWSNAGNWSPTGVPNSNTTNVSIIDGTSTVTLDTSTSIANLQLASGNALSLSAALTVNGTQIVNNGQIVVSKFLDVPETTTLEGTGTVVLSGGIGGGTLINQSTIEGSGDIFQGTYVINSGGTINADGGELSGSLATIDNTGGTLEATNGGVLNLDYTETINNAGGTILASGPGSQVHFNSGSQINGGNITTANGGTMGPESYFVTLNGITRGPLTITAGSTWMSAGYSTTAVGTIIDNGNMQFGGGGVGLAPASLLIGGDTVLQGSGTLTFSPNTDGTPSIVSWFGSYTLTNQSTIQGSGVVAGACSSECGALALVNEGLIVANVPGQTLTVTPTSLMNSGTLQVESGSTMSLGIGSGSVTNTGIFNVNTGGTMILDITAGSGTLTNSGAINVTNSTFAINDGGNGNTATLSGGGTLNLSGGTITGSFGDETFVNNDNTIQGSGTISNLNFINHGTVNVTGLGGLVVGPGTTGTFINSGTINVDSSNLAINANYNSDFTGTLNLENGSTGKIVGSVIGYDTGGQILIDNSSLTVVGTFGMENTTVNQGTLRIQGDVQQPDGGQLNLLAGSSAVVTGSLGGYGQHTVIDSSSLVVQGSFEGGRFTTVNLSNAALLSVNGDIDIAAASFSMTNGSLAVANGDFMNYLSSLSIDDSTLQVAGTFANNGPGTVTVGPAGLLSAGNYLQSGPDSPMLCGVALTDITGTLLTNSYRQEGGVTTVENGGLIEAGSFLATGGAVTVNGLLDPSAVEIGSGATLDGTGIIIGNVAMSGMITPGSASAPGTLAIIGDYEQIGSGVFDEMISAASSHGLLDVTGDVTLDADSQLDISLLDGFDPLGDSFTIMDYSALLGEFSNGSNFIADGYDWTLHYDSHDAVLTAVASAPEPGTVPLLAIGLLAVCGYGWKKRASVV